MKRNSKVMIIVGILILSFGVTFAYFVANTFTSGNGTSVVATTVNLNNSTLKIEGTLEFEDLDIYPGHTVVSAIKVTATGDNELIRYNLIWKGINEISALNYKVYRTSSSINVTSSCEKKTNTKNGVKEYFEECEITNLDQLGTEVETGRIIKNDTKAILVKDEFITATKQGQVVYYYVLLEYPNLDTSQNGDIDASFDGIVTVEESDKKPDINILAIKVEQEDGSYKEETEIPTTGYAFVQSKSQCSNDAVPGWDSKNKRFYANNLTKSGTTCYLTFDILKPQTSKTIIADIRSSNIYKGDNATPDFTKIAESDGTSPTDNSGVYRVLDPMYGNNRYSYYWRGAVLNNYVMFANKCWRIVRINGDGSIRLIYDGTTCHANGTNTDNSIIIKNQTFSKDGVKDNSAYVGYTFVKDSQRTKSLDINATSNLKKQIDDWFNNDANFTAIQRDKVAEGYFCNDRRTKNDETWRPTGATQYYAAYPRIFEGKQEPSLACLNEQEKGSDIYILKAGAITVDEVQFAGASGGSQNIKYYLFNGQYYWTMSPYQWHSDSNRATMFYVNDNGYLGSFSVEWAAPGIRPVINLKADVIFNEGSDGTIDNPYIVQ